jgi:renalase
MWDVAIVGAGLSGLACAAMLRKAGHQRIVVIDKSRGLGGRVATRRVENTAAQTISVKRNLVEHISVDHGSPSLPQSVSESPYRLYLDFLRQQGLIQSWPTDKIYEVKVTGQGWELGHSQSVEGFTAPTGMTTIAKVLAADLEIYRAQRVLRIQKDSENGWELLTDASEPLLRAKSLVLALPAPQALELCQPLGQEGQVGSVVKALQQVVFDPCFTVIAGYSAQDLSWSELRCPDDLFVQRVLCESHKRSTPHQTWLTVHSTPAFAAQHLEHTDVLEVGQQLLEYLGQHYVPWMARPAIVQVHRWRYAIAKSGYPGQPLSAFGRSLWVCGDWCTGPSLQDAFEAGIQVAQQIQGEL